MPIFLHGSKHDFDAFSLESAGRSERAENGALGVWLTSERRIAAAFGDDGYIYTVEVPEGPVYDMPIREFVMIHDAARDEEDVFAYYEAIRRQKMAEGYLRIDIIEKDGSAPTCICLDPDHVTILERERISDCSLGM